uniref:Uncharacterized protein n=1 Tax=Arundo donax TaxID=35708 RepID=A0A0A9D7C8_ARUDO
MAVQSFQLTTVKLIFFPGHGNDSQLVTLKRKQEKRLSYRL